MKTEEFSRKHFGVSCSAGRRSFKQITTVVLHSTEGPDADSAAAYLHGRPDGSAHVVLDSHDAYLMASDSTICCGVGGFNTPALHIEQAGYARYPKRRWLHERGEIKRAAYWAAHYSLKHDIPPRHLSPADLATGKRHGWTTHGEITQSGIAQTTHTDPGPGYPVWLFQHYLNSYMRQGRRGGLKLSRHG